MFEYNNFEVIYTPRTILNALDKNSPEYIKVLFSEDKFLNRYKICPIKIIKYCFYNHNFVIAQFLMENYYDEKYDDLLFSSFTDKTLDCPIYLLNKGATDYNSGLIGAIESNNLEGIMLMVKSGATNLNDAIVKGISYKDRDIECFIYLIEQGITNYDECLVECIKYNKSSELIKLFINNITNYDKLFDYACIYDNQDMLEHAIENGINTYQSGLKITFMNGSLKCFNLLLDLDTNPTMFLHEDYPDKLNIDILRVVFEYTTYPVDRLNTVLYDIVQDNINEHIPFYEYIILFIEAGANNYDEIIEIIYCCSDGFDHEKEIKLLISLLPQDTDWVELNDNCYVTSVDDSLISLLANKIV